MIGIGVIFELCHLPSNIRFTASDLTSVFQMDRYERRGFIAKFCKCLWLLGAT